MEIICVALAGGIFFDTHAKKKKSAWSNSGMENQFAEKVFVLANVEVRRLGVLSGFTHNAQKHGWLLQQQMRNYSSVSSVKS